MLHASRNVRECTSAVTGKINLFKKSLEMIEYFVLADQCGVRCPPCSKEYLLRCDHAIRAIKCEEGLTALKHCSVR
jgi:hypothetical protein